MRRRRRTPAAPIHDLLRRSWAVLGPLLDPGRRAVRRTPALIIPLVFSSSLMVPGAVSPAAVSPAAAAPGGLTLRGDLTAGAVLYPDEQSRGRDVEWELGGELELSWRPRPAWRMQVNPRLWWDPLDPGRWRWVPREAWVGYRTGPLRLRAGRQVLGWGSADTYRPTDLVSNRDWGRDFLDPEKAGDWSLTASLGGRRLGLEIVYLPVLDGVDFPSARSPWSLESAQSKLGIVPVPLVEDPWIPSDVSEQSLATRARITTGRTDIYLVGYTGVDRQPLLALDQVCEDPECLQSSLVLRAAYPRLHLGGIEVQAAVGDLLLKAEATYRDQTSSDREFDARVAGLRGHSMQVVAGIDYLWLEAFGGAGDLDIIVEFLYDDAAAGDGLQNYRPFQRDLAAVLTYLANDLSGSSLELGWVQDLDRAESVGTLRVRRRLRHRLTVEAGADLIRGPDEPTNPYALFATNDRVILRLVYGF